MYADCVGTEEETVRNVAKAVMTRGKVEFTASAGFLDPEPTWSIPDNGCYLDPLCPLFLHPTTVQPEPRIKQTRH